MQVTTTEMTTNISYSISATSTMMFIRFPTCVNNPRTNSTLSHMCHVHQADQSNCWLGVFGASFKTRH